MPRRRVTIAALMLLVLFIGLVAALVRGELENRRLRAQLEAANVARATAEAEAQQAHAFVDAMSSNMLRPVNRDASDR